MSGVLEFAGVLLDVLNTTFSEADIKARKETIYLSRLRIASERSTLKP